MTQYVKIFAYHCILMSSTVHFAKATFICQLSVIFAISSCVSFLIGGNCLIADSHVTVASIEQLLALLK